MRSKYFGLRLGILVSFLSVSIFAQSVPTITVGQAQNCNIGWDQTADSLTDAQTNRYDVVTNGLAPVTTPATCSGQNSPYLCKIPLPIKTVGTHNVTIQSYLSDGTPGGISATFTFKITGNPPQAPANLRLITN